MTRRNNRRPVIRYALISIWLIGLLLTLALYRQREISFPVRDPKTGAVSLRTVTEGYETQQIVVMFLGVGLFMWLASLLLEAGSPRVPRPVLRYVPRYKRHRSLWGLLSAAELRCPQCAGVDIHRSRKTGADWLLGFFLIAPYRCHTCFQRFYRFAHFTRAA